MSIFDSNRTDDNDNSVVAIGESGSANVAELGTTSGGKTALEVIAEVTEDLEGEKAVGCFSSKYRIETSETAQTLTTSFASTYSYSGSGKFHGFIHDFNNDDIEIKLTIDGEEIFNIPVNTLVSIGYTKIICNTLGFNVTGSNEIFEFCPTSPICFNTSVLIECRKTVGGTRRVDRRVTFITKAT